MNKVFILGAGASYPAGVPLMKEIFTQGIFHLRMGSVSGDSLNRYPQFCAYLKDRFNYDVNFQGPMEFAACKDVDIEKVLSSIDNEIFDNNDEELAQVRKEAVRFVYLTLEQAIIDGPKKNNCYTDFASQRINISKDDNTIITFNYETLMERALPRGCFSYGIDVEKDNIQNFPSYEREYRNNLLVLKPHGSLNWAICSQCNKLHLFFSQRYDDIFQKKCCNCGTDFEAVLVPPTRFKEGKYLRKLWEAANLERLWTIAGEKIAYADEISIIGYSFNKNDKEAFDLILNSMKANSKKPNLYIADTDPKKIYRKIFKKDLLKKGYFRGVYLFGGFRDYLDNNSYFRE